MRDTVGAMVGAEVRQDWRYARRLTSSHPMSRLTPPPLPSLHALWRLASCALLSLAAATALAQDARSNTQPAPPTLRVGPDQRYTTIGEALADAPSGATIRIAPGIYREVIRLQTPGVRLLGEGLAPQDVVIEASRSAADTGATSKSAVVFAEANGVEIHNLTIANRFHDEHPEVTQGAQAVALYASGDRQRYVGLHLISYQDTLYAARRSCGSPPCPPARQYYRDTTIIGAVDFIFGNALAYFERANIYGVQRPQVIVTAQSCERPDEVCGYVFRNSRIHADPSVRQIVLGRPWRALSTVSFLDSELDGRVIPAGFIDWNQENRLPTTRYLESGSRGPGAVPLAQRQAYMRPADAATLEPMASANRYLAGSDGWQAEIFEGK